MYSKGDLWYGVVFSVCMLMSVFGVWVALPILINIIVTIVLVFEFIVGVLFCYNIARVLDGEESIF